MAEPIDDDAPVAGLEGWGTPAPRSDFVDRVLARTDALAPDERVPRRRAWALPFALGAVAGGVLVAATFALRGDEAPVMAPRAREEIHVQVPGFVEVVGEPDAEVQWERGADGRIVVEVVEGVAWVRRLAGAAQVELRAGDERVELGGSCGRIAVERRWLSIDTDVDDVDCAQIDAAIERAELSADEPR